MLLPILAFVSLQLTRLKVGTTWSGREVLHFVSKEAEIDESYRYKVSFRITGRDEGMWVVEKGSTLLGSRIDDTEMPPPPYPDPTLSKQWLSPAGFLLNAEPFERGVFDLDRLLHCWLPANKPEEWNVDLKTTDPRLTVSGRAEFKVVGKAAGPTMKYSMTYSSTGEKPGIGAKGDMWFDVASGRLVQAKIEASNALLPGGRERVNVSITYADGR